MKKFLVPALAAALAFIGCAPKQTSQGPDICAHRGFWKCEDIPAWENTVASLRAAQEYEFWGSEFDVHITADDIVVVHHNDQTQEGLDIHTSTYEQLAGELLPNGETIPTIDEYLEQGEQSNCMLVCEFKPEGDPERARKMVDVTVDALKAHGLWDPSRVMFISFDLEVCKRIAADFPEFTNQYLEGDIAPAALKEMGINGIDYHFQVFHNHPEWVAEAHDLGMSVNVWTVDTEDEMQYLIDLGVDCITTNEPLMLRDLLTE